MDHFPEIESVREPWVRIIGRLGNEIPSAKPPKSSCVRPEWLPTLLQVDGLQLFAVMFPETLGDLKAIISTNQ